MRFSFRYFLIYKCEIMVLWFVDVIYVSGVTTFAEILNNSINISLRNESRLIHTVHLAYSSFVIWRGWCTLKSLFINQRIKILISVIMRSFIIFIFVSVNSRILVIENIIFHYSLIVSVFKYRIVISFVK